MISAPRCALHKNSAVLLIQIIRHRACTETSAFNGHQTALPGVFYEFQWYITPRGLPR